MRVYLRIKLDKVLKDRGLTQIALVEKLNEERLLNGIEKKVRPAAISELYNNQRKTLNKELIEEIASVLNIYDVTELIELHK